LDCFKVACARGRHKDQRRSAHHVGTEPDHIQTITGRSRAGHGTELLGDRRYLCYSSQVRRAFALVMLLLVVGTATGAFAAVTQEASCEDCGEQGTGCCPPVCPQCVCIARGVTADVVAAGVVVPPPEGGAVVRVGEDAGAPESAEPGEIFHVPIVGR